jgi:hypothetical protein
MTEDKIKCYRDGIKEGKIETLKEVEEIINNLGVYGNRFCDIEELKQKLKKIKC